MAQRTIRVDDLDGSEGDVETTVFGFEGAQYKIDLSAENYKVFKDLMDRYVKAGEYMRGSALPRYPEPKQAPDTSGYTRTEVAPSGQSRTQMIRNWYAEQPVKFRMEYPLSANGRIPQAIQDAYDKAQVGSPE